MIRALRQLSWANWPLRAKRTAQFGLGIGGPLPFGWAILQISRGNWSANLANHVVTMSFLGVVGIIFFGVFGYLLALHEQQLHEDAGTLLFEQQKNFPTHRWTRALQFGFSLGVMMPVTFLGYNLLPEEPILIELYQKQYTYLSMFGVGVFFFGLFGFIFGIHEERLYALATLADQAQHDYRTGLKNARYFWTQARKEIARAERHGYPLSLVIFDLDNFKDINDTYGHLTGNKVLKSIGDSLNNKIRRYDVVTRLGGDEFAILLPNASLSEAIRVADRTYEYINDPDHQAEDKQESFCIEASFGVASINPKTENSLNRLFARADDALYRAKDSEERIARSLPPAIEADTDESLKILDDRTLEDSHQPPDTEAIEAE